MNAFIILLASRLTQDSAPQACTCEKSRKKKKPIIVYYRMSLCLSVHFILVLFMFAEGFTAVFGSCNQDVGTLIL